MLIFPYSTCKNPFRNFFKLNNENMSENAYIHSNKVSASRHESICRMNLVTSSTPIEGT